MIFRIVVIAAGGISLLFSVMDIYKIGGFQMNSTIIKFIVYLVAVICGLLIFIIDLVDIFATKQ